MQRNLEESQRLSTSSMGIRVRRLNTVAFDVVARGLTYCTSLTHLRISDIMIEAGAVHGLAKVLGQCPALAHLEVKCWGSVQRWLTSSLSYNTVMYLSELSEQLDVTLESSKIVKLALTWVAMNRSDAIK
jgi:hypothetical protein